tara:strand:- start:417 stop:713 length:297 start_codon:yes stop_codon:yes gene_type:complete
MTCKICNGNMRYQIPNHYHETMEWVDCMDCVLEAQFKETVAIDVARLLSKASAEKLSLILSTMIVNTSNDLNRVYDITKQKNLNHLLMLADCYAEALE